MCLLLLHALFLEMTLALALGFSQCFSPMLWLVFFLLLMK
jgi:hypothetical protein